MKGGDLRWQRKKQKRKWLKKDQPKKEKRPKRKKQKEEDKNRFHSKNSCQEQEFLFSQF